MGRAHFLLCLPARLGVLLFSLAEFIATGALAALMWIILVRNEQNKDIHLSKPLFIGVVTLGILSTIISLVSFAGFMGAVFKRVRGVRAFARLIAWLLGIQIVLSVLYIIAILVEPKSEFIKQCENGSTDANVVDTCTNKITEVKAITVGIIVVALLLHSYEVYVVGAYASELEHKHANRNIILGNSKYAAVPVHDMSYPYSDGHHSYGHHQSGSHA